MTTLPYKRQGQDLTLKISLTFFGSAYPFQNYQKPEEKDSH